MAELSCRRCIILTNIEQIQNRILEQMQEILSNEQLQKLENVMAVSYTHLTLPTNSLV